MSDEHSLLDEFKLRGRWWLPEQPQTVVPGILYYRPEESIRLDLMGSLEEFIGSDPGTSTFPLPPVRRPFILGTTDRGEGCTLSGVLESRRVSGTLEELQVYSDVLVDNLFLGAHFPNEEALAFRSVYVSFTHVEDWLGIDPLGVPPPAQPTAPLDLRVPYHLRKLFETDVPSLKAVISLYSSVTCQSEPGRSLSLFHRPYFEIDAGMPRAFAWYLEPLLLCRQFLAFLVGAPVYPSMLRAQPVKGEIKVYRPPWCQRNVRERVHTARLPFGLIQSQAGNVLRCWFKNAERLRPVYEFAVAGYYRDRMNLQAEFLGLAQALEIVHRRQHGREYKFRQRLQGLFDGLSEGTRSRIESNVKDFVQRVEDSRNYLVHYGEKGRAFNETKAYFEANNKLRALLFVLLCKELGIPEELAGPFAFGPGATSIV
jgi:hypothetical protein